MGVDVIRISGDKGQVEPILRMQDLAPISFQTFHVPNPPMSVWLMSVPTGKAIFPWWRYESQSDEDLRTLSEVWSVSTIQHLFDCLYLTSLQRLAGPDFFVVFPGSLTSKHWAALRDQDRDTLTRGQACIYHLQGSFNGKLVINWVPFFQPQSLVKNPGVGSFWRLFSANATSDMSNAITFFCLSKKQLLPEVINQLIHKDDQRSEKLSALVDWFGMYSSPLEMKYAAASVVYSRKPEIITAFESFQKTFEKSVDQLRNELISDPRPRTAIRALSRQIAL